MVTTNRFLQQRETMVVIGQPGCSVTVRGQPRVDAPQFLTQHAAVIDLALKVSLQLPANLANFVQLIVSTAQTA
jgi:hypothetical protein